MAGASSLSDLAASSDQRERAVEMTLAAGPRALRKQDLRERGQKALVAEFGVANAIRFVMELHEGQQDYSTLRGTLFAEKTLDELYAEIRPAQRSDRQEG